MSTLGPKEVAPPADGGEWELVGRDIIRTKVRRSANGQPTGGQIIAQFWTSPTREHAALMVAAPSLLAALTEASEALAYAWRGADAGGEAEAKFHATNRRIAEALAKAKGGPAAPPPDPTLHARTSPGPVNCNTVLRLQHPSVPRPRTCMRCGLGPCPFFDKDGNSLRKGGAL